MSSHSQVRGVCLSLLGAVAIAGTIGGCGQGSGGSPGTQGQPAGGTEGHVSWNSPFLRGWSSGNGPEQPPVTVPSVEAARKRIAGRQLPFQIRTLPGLGQPFRILTDPWPDNTSVHRAAVALQYHTPHGLADVVEIAGKAVTLGCPMAARLGRAAAVQVRAAGAGGLAEGEF